MKSNLILKCWAKKWGGASRNLKWLSNRWCFLWSIIYVINICNSIISTLLILIFELVALVDVLLFVWECWHRFVVIISELSSLVRSILFSGFLPKFLIVKTSHKIFFWKNTKLYFRLVWNRWSWSLSAIIFSKAFVETVETLVPRLYSSRFHETNLWQLHKL